jgi:capsular exopolysaccharide synthesis family protein
MSAANRPTYELATGSPAQVQINPQGLLRGLARNWWRILLLWGVVTGPLVYLIYTVFEPTYEAYAVIQAEPAQETLFGSKTTVENSDAIERYIASQIEYIQTDRDLNKALATAEVVAQPFVKNSKYPLMDLKEKLRVVNRNNTFFIQVFFESTSNVEASVIVNAVVTAYLSSYGEYRQGFDKKLRDSLEEYLKRLEKEKALKEAELLTIVEKGNVNAEKLGAAESKETEGETATTMRGAAQDGPAARDVTIEQYRDYKKRILDKEYEQSMLEYALQQRLADPRNQESDAETEEGLVREALEARIKELFQHDPAVVAVTQEILASNEELNHTKNVARRGYDPARLAAKQHIEQLTAKHDRLWDERYNDLRQQVIAERAAAGSGTLAPNALTADELRTRLEMVRHEITSLNQMLKSMDVEKKTTESDIYKAKKLEADISTLRGQHQMIYKKFEDLKFTSNKDLFRVELLSPAAVLKAPTSNKRIKLMLAAPVMMLGLVLGLFALLEIKAERVADPDALSTRVQSEVFSLPPLPMARASKKLNGPAEDDQIDRFIQRLDHLRFAVCGDHPEVGLGRCVLITSAIGGEGKTTLAAQLAARCGHAGHTTLLIDADLRRGALCPLLDVPEGLGLSDVMQEKANVEDVVIPVQGGTFHLLCAGTPVGDTSRIFQGRNFGMLIARLRQMYDLIIIDSPPVLPVPDGLILGRWTDGAVLASRYDVSRAPQVERARRQLNNAGIPVLGPVINGMKSSDAYYGRYSYSRGRSGFTEPDDSPTT